MKNRTALFPMSQRGTALLLTLWCISVVSITVVMVARLVDSDMEGESARSRRFEAREFAYTGIAHGSNPNLKRSSEFLHQTLEDGRKLDVHISSENSRLNIHQVLHQQDQVILKRLFTLWGIPDDEARVAIDSMVDWVDADELRQLNGAERENLQGQTRYSLPMNRNFHSVSEMAKVRGMDAVARHKPDWANYFSIFSSGQLDAQDAPTDLLRVVGGLSQDQANALISFRNGADKKPGTADDRGLLSLEDAVKRAGLSGEQAKNFQANFRVGGEPTRIESIGVAGGAPYRILAIINRSQQSGLLLSWEEL